MLHIAPSLVLRFLFLFSYSYHHFDGRKRNASLSPSLPLFLLLFLLLPIPPNPIRDISILSFLLFSRLVLPVFCLCASARRKKKGKKCSTPTRTSTTTTTTTVAAILVLGLPSSFPFQNCYQLNRVSQKKTEPTLLSFAGHVFDVMFLLVAQNQKIARKRKKRTCHSRLCFFCRWQ